ncbi:uncharacterized protein EI90DRAFT_3051717 [Cantharellus anzutake]|uniref:uncharacterized protein n=1 Tax=Cantharellus anzutake TaxID=1750568 RepID=UPI0019053C46|nr:uncharacterized protein EI90DRAFT_3051717 [Cantharellus anzutake]KAF8334294.1 hypothetical protein EI90DRAFT_3051717 [Cantharellus anzutake]
MENQQRPGMRRKSSASNLLSTFQGSRSNSIQNISTGAAQTPKDWEPGAATADHAFVTGVSTPTTSSYESIRETLNRRLLALAHLRQGHEGRSYWLNTILLSHYELERAYNTASMRKRTYKYAILAMSLSNLFDSTPHSDFLRSLGQLMNEYDQLQDENFKPRMRNILRGSKGVRGRSGETFDDQSCLVIPNMPFPLDYFQVLMSFCDVLTEVYHKIRQVLGPSPLQHAGMANSVPGSGYSISIHQHIFSSTNPLFTQLFPNELASSSFAPDTTASVPPSAPLSSPPATWSPGTADAVLKVDARFKKIINQLLKELDTIAREAIKDELASLDPLLRNMGLASPEASNGLTFDFDI